MKKSYSKENRAHRKLYWDFGLAGFGSGFNLLVLAICYAEKSKLKFVLFSKYSSISYQNGFTDYFLPFAEPEKNETILFPYISFRFPQKKSKIKKVLISIIRHAHFLLKEKRRNVIHFEDMASRIWNPNFISSNSFEDYQEIAKRIWRFNSETRNYCESKIEALSLPNSYACIHVRRGDKSTEVQEPFPDISKYIEYAQTNEIEVE